MDQLTEILERIQALDGERLYLLRLAARMDSSIVPPDDQSASGDYHYDRYGILRFGSG